MKDEDLADFLGRVSPWLDPLAEALAGADPRDAVFALASTMAVKLAEIPPDKRLSVVVVAISIVLPTLQDNR